MKDMRTDKQDVRFVEVNEDEVPPLELFPTEPEPKKHKPTAEDVDRLYSLYPTFCKTRNHSTGKGRKDKEKIKTLLKTISVEELEFTIKAYVKECEETKAYLKNFSTFLNNLPDMGYNNQPEPEKEDEDPKSDYVKERIAELDEKISYYK
jgi:hypothetical protein